MPAVAQNWKNIIPYAVLAGAVCAAYSGVYHNAFLYDDERLIVDNAYLRDWRHLPDLFTSMLSAGNASDNTYYRPMQTLLYLIIYQIAGLSTVAFHSLNVGLHALNTCLVWRLGRKLGFNAYALFGAALIWALHPVHTEAVTYMSATADVLQAFFCLLGMTILLPDFSRLRMVLASLCMVLALLSKETSVMFPLLALSLIYFTNKKRFDLRSYLCLWPLFAIMAAYIVLHVLLAPQMHAITMSAVTAGPEADFEPFATLPMYLHMLIWPVGLHMEHDVPAYASPWSMPVIAGMLVVAGTILQLQRTQSKTSLPISWGLLWFFTAHAPLIFLASKVYEHWLYLPSVGLILGAAQSIYLCIAAMPRMEARMAGRGVFVAVLIVAASYGTLAYAQNRIWRNAETFYGNTLAYGEEAPNFHINLGIVYARRGEYDMAIDQYRQAVETAGSHALSPANLATVETDWGSTLLAMPDSKAHSEEALKHFERALDADPENYAALHSLAEYYERHNDKTKAALYQSKARAARAKFITSTDKQ